MSDELLADATHDERDCEGAQGRPDQRRGAARIVERHENPCYRQPHPASTVELGAEAEPAEGELAADVELTDEQFVSRAEIDRHLATGGKGPVAS